MYRFWKVFNQKVGLWIRSSGSDPAVFLTAYPYQLLKCGFESGSSFKKPWKRFPYERVFCSWKKTIKDCLKVKKQWSFCKFTWKFEYKYNYYPYQFPGIFSVFIFKKFPPPDPGGKLNADPDPQYCLKVTKSHVYAASLPNAPLYWTSALAAMRATRTVSTPWILLTCFSMAATQEAHVIPVSRSWQRLSWGAASSSPPDVDTAEINKKLLKMYRIMQRCNQRSVPLPLPKNLPVKCQYRSVLVLEIFWIDICR